MAAKIKIIFLYLVEELLPGRTALDKNPLPPIKSCINKNNVDEQTISVTNVTNAVPIPSPKRLPRVNNRLQNSVVLDYPLS